MSSKRSPSVTLSRQRRLTLLDANEDVDVYISIPTDKGYGWIIVAAAFLGNVLVDGITFNFGSFLKPMCATFGVKTASIALLLSIQNGIYYMSGPFISALINKIGFRLTGLIGVVLSSIGLLLSAYMETLSLLLLTFSLITGIGYGIINCTGILITGHYFEKYRALANGITMCGSGAGTVIMGQVVTFMLKEYDDDWRYIFKIMSACFVLLFFGVATYRPIKQKKVKAERKLAFDENDGNSSDSSEITIDFTKNKLSTLRFQNLSIYTISEESSFESKRIKEPSIAPPALSPATRTKKTRNFFSKICPCLSKERKKLKFARKIRARPVYRDDAFYTHSLCLLPEYDEVRSFRQSIGTKNLQNEEFSRKSLEDEAISYHLSVVRIPSYEEFPNKKIEEHTWYEDFIGTIVRTLALLFDPKFFKIGAFYLVAFAMMNNTVGMMLPSVFLIDRLKNDPDSDQSVQSVMMSIGISNMVGRFTSGSLIFCRSVSATIVASIFAAICAITSMSIAFVDNSQLTELNIICVIFGFSIGLTNSLRTLIYVENFGLENLTNVYGLISVAIGLGAICGPLVSAHLKDQTNDYFASFIFGGSCLMISTVALIFTAIVKMRTSK